MSGRASYTKVGSFPSSYRFIRIGDKCVFKATKLPRGWKPNAEVNGTVIRIHVEGSNPHIIVQLDPLRHSMLSTLFVVYPKGHPDFNFYLKIKGTGLGSRLMIRGQEERKAIFQGDLILPFGK